MLGRDEFTLTVSFAFTVGNDAYHFYWETCSKDTEAQDGLGLPGAHNCGAASIPVPPGYLG